jgi:hypothetical protein
MNINKIKQHKILSFFNILAVGLIILGNSTDFLVANSGTSISGAIAAWGGFLLIVMIFIDGVVVIRHSTRKSNDQRANTNIVPSVHEQRMSKVKGISIIVGAFLGILVTYFLLAGQGGDAGLIFIPLAAVFAPLGAFMLFTLAKILFGEHEEKKSAIKLFVIVALLIAAYISYGYYQDKYGQKYCDGVSVQQYKGSLPSECQNQ